MELGQPENGGMVGAPRKKARAGRQKRAAPALFVGQWIRALGLTQTAVAKGARVNEGYLSELCAGKKVNPSAWVLMDIADFLGVPLQYLRQPPPDRAFISQAIRLDPAVMARLQQNQ